MFKQHTQQTVTAAKIDGLLIIAFLVMGSSIAGKIAIEFSGHAVVIVYIAFMLAVFTVSISRYHRHTIEIIAFTLIACITSFIAGIAYFFFGMVTAVGAIAFFAIAIALVSAWRLVSSDNVIWEKSAAAA